MMLYIFPMIAFSQVYDIGDSVFVWRKGGLSVLSKPDPNSEIVDSLFYGEGLVIAVQELRIINAQEKISDEFELSGNWVKVYNGVIEGYIPDCHISKYRPEINGFDRWDLINKTILGPIKNSEKNPKEIILNGTKYQVIEEYTFHENGYTKEYYFDGCDDYAYCYYSMSFNEVYNLMVNTFTIQYHDYVEKPEFLYQKGESYFFSGTEAIGGYEIKKEKEGVSLTMYSCN